jgi:hypothetical protein
MDGIDDSLWSNVKALQGPEWKGRFRKKVGPYRIIFTKFPNVAAVVISAFNQVQGHIQVAQRCA